MKGRAGLLSAAICKHVTVLAEGEGGWVLLLIAAAVAAAVCRNDLTLSCTQEVMKHAH